MVATPNSRYWGGRRVQLSSTEQQSIRLVVKELLVSFYFAAYLGQYTEGYGLIIIEQAASEHSKSALVTIQNEFLVVRWI